MRDIYEARGNIYVVATPDEVEFPDAQLAHSAEQAAQATQANPPWTQAEIARLCSRTEWEERIPHGWKKPHASDGLLIGPFGAGPPYELLIVNTDGLLAERSGNGLTIFARFLVDRGYVSADANFDLVVRSLRDPVKAPVQPARRDSQSGFWVDMGVPWFGPEAVDAVASELTARAKDDGAAWAVHRLRDIDRAWDRSVLVSLGNPHCVTFVVSDWDLPAFESLEETRLHIPLTAIADALTRDADLGRDVSFRRGINLQWAHVRSARGAGGEGLITARIFERSEGPTRSSGSSATAVACAAWHLGLLRERSILVKMPCGEAPIELDVNANDRITRARLFGIAKKL